MKNVERTPVRTVLIVDDSVKWCHLVVAALERAGYDVRCAHTVDEGLAILEDWEADLVISDYQMPVKTGDELFRQVARRRPDLIESGRFFFVSANAFEVVDSIKDHAIDVIEKPARLRDIVARVAAA